MNVIESVGMTGVLLIDIGIGVIFAFLTFSLIASAVQEALAGMLNWRGKHLEKAIRHILADPGEGKTSLPEQGLDDRLLSHPLINGLKGPRSMITSIFRGQEYDRMPSAIPKATFARAFLESLVLRRAALTEHVADARDAFGAAVEHVEFEIDRLTIDHQLKARLKKIVETVGSVDDLAEDVVARKLVQAQAEVELWFDNAMDRVTGWYIRRVKVVLFAIGLLMAGAVNFDMIGYAQELSRNEDLRNRIVAQAEIASESGQLGAYRIIQNADDGDGQLSPAELTEVRAQLRKLEQQVTTGLDTLQNQFADPGAPIGWSGIEKIGPADIARMMLSWVLIGLGCTMGGQFWFDLLKRALKVRAGASGLNSDIKEASEAVRNIDTKEIVDMLRREVGEQVGNLKPEDIVEIVRRELGRPG